MPETSIRERRCAVASGTLWRSPAKRRDRRHDCGRQACVRHLRGARRILITERTKAGIAATRARGRNGGAPFKTTSAKLRLAQAAVGKPGDEDRRALPRTRRHPSNSVSLFSARRIAVEARRQAARSPQMTDHSGGNDKGLTRFGCSARCAKTRSASPRLHVRVGSQFPTLRRWLRLYRLHGMAGLQPRPRAAT